MVGGKFLFLEKFWEKRLARWVDQLRDQRNLPIRLVLWNGRHYDFCADFGTFTPPHPQLTLHVQCPAALPALLRPSVDHLAQAYVTGKIEIEIDIESNLTDAIGLSYALVKSYQSHQNHQAFAKSGRFSKLSRLGRSFTHLLAYLRGYFNHTRTSDKKFIQYHYDVSNAFYQLWLDQRMVYSCAYFENGDEDLETAQLKKIDHILTKIQARPDHTLLDIGCGWGALAIRAAQKFGMKVVGVTLSQNQFEIANARVKAAGLSDQIDIRCQDYRDITGQFDRVTSVGMFEHVGHKNLPSYFAKIHACLKENGIAMNHGITSTALNANDAEHKKLGGGQFINRFVFPGGELPALDVALAAMRQSGLEVIDVENLRRHYARTLRVWSENFERRTAEIKRLIDEKKFRIWRLYLAGCAHAFENDHSAIYQVVCCKAGQSAQNLRWSRKYMYGV